VGCSTMHLLALAQVEIYSNQEYVPNKRTEPKKVHSPLFGIGGNVKALPIVLHPSSTLYLP